MLPMINSDYLGVFSILHTFIIVYMHYFAFGDSFPDSDSR